MSLQFIPYEKGDGALYLQFVKDLQVMTYITARALSETEGKAEFQEILAYNQMHTDGSGYFKVLSDDDYLGFAKVSWTKKSELEVGYMLLPEYWGQGYAQQMLKHLLQLTDSRPALATAKVLAVIDPNNGASRHLLTKHDFVSTWIGVENGLPTEYLYLKK